MSKARPKRVLEDVPEDIETGWAPGSAFAEGGLHIPLDSSSTSTQQDDIHRRQSVAALQKAGNVRNRLAAFEANLKLEPVEEVQVRKSWRGTWKKPKQDSPEALASPRNPISGAFAAALRKSGPAPAAAQLPDASTPLRSSTGNLASRAKEGSPFLKTVQGFLALRRSSGSGLSIASPVDQAGSAPETFSPLGSGLSTAAAAEPPAAPPQQQATTEALQHTAAQADASAAKASAITDVFERADEPQCAAKPAQEKETGLPAALAAEAALKAQEKGLKTPGEGLKPSPVTPRMGASEASSGAGSALLQGSPVMTVGTAEPTHKKKALRSPLRSPVAAERSPTLAQAPDMASSVDPPATAQTLAEAPGVQPEPVPGAAPLQPWVTPASPGPAEAVRGNSNLAVALQAHGRDCATEEIARANPEVRAAVSTADNSKSSGDTIATASPMVEHSAPVQLEIPETQPATPQGSVDGQQASPLLMSIKKLVHHQEAVEGGRLSSLECTEHLLAPACTESPSPVPQGPHGWRGAMLEADDVAGDVTSPILQSSDLRSAVAAAQARMQAETATVGAPQQQAEIADGCPDELSETAAEHAPPPQPACGGIAENESEAATGTVPQCSNEQRPSVADSEAGDECKSASLEQVSEGGTRESKLRLPTLSHAAGSPASQALLEQAAEQVPHADLADSTGLQASAEKGAEQNTPAEFASTQYSALSVQVDSGSEAMITPPADVPGQQAAQDTSADASASASSFHTLASPLRPLEGLQSPELLACMSPGTPADITLQQTTNPSAAPSARALDSPSGQEGLQSPELLPSMSPGTPAEHKVQPTDGPSSGAAAGTQAEISMQTAQTPDQSADAALVCGAPAQEAEESASSLAPTFPEGGSAIKTPLSQALAPARAQALPADTPAEAGNFPVELQLSEEAPVDDDDASSATETCESVSVCDSEALAEPGLPNAGDPTAAGGQRVPPLDTDRVQRMLEPRSRRSFRTPERELHLPPASSLSPPQRGAADAPPFTAAAALMLRSPGARHGPLSPRSRLSPRSVPPLPQSRLFAVSPRSGSSPELDSPLEEAVEELISAACNLEDVQVPPSSSKKPGRIESLTPIGRILLSPGEYSPMSAAAAAQAAGMLTQQLQPLSPFPMGDSPALGTGYRAPQNTPAACPASHPCSSAFHASGALSPGAPWDSAGTVRLARERGAGSPAEAPGVQDLLAAFRRAAGQEPLPVSPISAPANAASSPAAGMHADAPPALSSPPDPIAQPVPSPFSATLDACESPGAVEASEAQAGADDGHDAHDSLSDTPAACVSAQEGGAVTTASATIREPAAAVKAAPAKGQEADSEGTPADASMVKKDHIPEMYNKFTESPAPSEHLQMEGTQEATCQASGGVLEAQPGASVIKVSGTAGSLPSTACREAAGTTDEHVAAQPKMSQKGLSEDVRAGPEPQSSPRTSPRAMRSPRKSGRTPRPQKLQLEDAENALTPPGSPGQLGGKSPSKLAQSLGSPSSQLLRSPLAHRQLQLSSPAPTPLCESAAKAGEQTQPETQSPAPIAAPQMSPGPAGSLDTTPAGVPQGSTPATAPRAANPAAFLRNTNSIFSPDVPAEAAGPASRQLELHSKAAAMAGDEGEDLDTRFNLGQFSPPATRRLSTGQTPPLPAAISRSGSQAPGSRGPASAQGPHLQAHRQQHAALEMQSPSAQTPTGTALASADAERTEPESPVFDEAFALDAQLILGSMVTPGTAARPPPQRQAAPLEQVPEAASDGCGASQKAQEIVEEAAAEAGLIQGDTARLVKVMGPFLDALMGEMAEGEAQRDVLQLASQELRQKCEVLVDENRQLRKDVQKLETELFQVREEHAKTEQQFKTLYRSKYLPLKEEAQKCRQDIARLKACRAADAEACEKWRAQVATQQLQIRKADTDAEASGAKLRSLQAQLQAASAAAAKAAAMQEEADKAAALAAKKAARLEDQLHAAMAEKEVLVTQSAEASAKVAAAQAARDRAVKEGYIKEEESFSLKKRLQEFKRENDKFADIKAQLKGQVAQLQDDLAKKEEENKNLLHACEQLISEREAPKSAA